ncbi:unnamed protein product [Vitrella brassicaformis CCMP3155]|uniref:subtilisin n=1 Tax=Vitrella brassicaformis (strain CCMP3155) TaxID=1169540 RepID=A0A0G4ENK6_VITBC|nr:unnamed protein product [Vitrella brassicaformis CCMP3155]|eukprot:CEL99183.1 unnamed protein product [Vitrella brassicaformis CCMP3155]
MVIGRMRRAAAILALSVALLCLHPADGRSVAKYRGETVSAEEAAVDAKISWTLSSLIGIQPEGEGVRAPATVQRPRRQRQQPTARSRRDEVGGEQQAPLEAVSSFTTIRATDLVTVDVAATSLDDAPRLLEELQQVGMEDGEAFHKVVSGRLPVSAIDKLPSLPRLHYASRSFIVHRGAFDLLGSHDVATGQTTSQADAAHHVDVVRTTLGVTGRRQRIGIISDSFDTSRSAPGSAASDISTGDLPRDGVHILDDFNGQESIDEGRAMAQLVYDLAPGADLSFATAFKGAASFANNILRLAKECDIVVDDIGYGSEPFFQDGIVGRAAQKAAEEGTPYISAAGNDGINAYQAPFRDSGKPTVVDFGGRTNSLVTHDFDPSDERVADYQLISVPVGNDFQIILQWSEPWASASDAPGVGSRSDLDILMYDMADNLLNTKMATGGLDQNVGKDAYEMFAFENRGGIDVDGVPGADTVFKLKIVKWEGPDPEMMRYLIWSNSWGFPLTHFTGAPTLWGHPNMKDTLAAAAIYYADTPRYGSQYPTAEPTTSHGPTPIFYDTQGNKKPAGGDIRAKPDITAADGTHTTFFGTPVDNKVAPNFFGTSAAAPHVAAVIALLNEWKPGMTPKEIRDILFETALDLDDYIDLSQQGPGDFDEGHDYQTGHGLMDAYAAVTSLDNMPTCLTKAPAAEVACSATDGHCKGTSADNALVLSVEDGKGSLTADGEDGNDCISVTISEDADDLDLVKAVGGRGSDYLVIDGKVPSKAKVEVTGASSDGDDGSRDTILLRIDAGSDGRGVEVTVTSSGEGTPSTTDMILNFGVTKDEKCRADVIKVDSRGSSQLSYDDSRGEVRAGDKLVAMIYPPLPKDALTIQGSTVTRTCSFTVPELQQRPAVQLPPTTSRVGAESVPFIGLEPGTRDLPIPSLLNEAHVTNLIPEGPQAICGRHIAFQADFVQGLQSAFHLSCSLGVSMSQRMLFAEFDKPTFLSVTHNSQSTAANTGVFVFRGCETGMYREPSVWRGESWKNADFGVHDGAVMVPEPGLYVVLVSNICQTGFETSLDIKCHDAARETVVIQSANATDNARDDFLT